MSPKNNTHPTISIPSETEKNIAYGNLNKNNTPDDNMSIPTVVIQDPIYKHNIHQEITPQIPSALLIPQFNTHESTVDSERQTFKNKTS